MTNTSTETTRRFNIVRRAYGVYEVTGTFTGTWSSAQCEAMRVQAEKHDGEYYAYGEGEVIGPGPAGSSYQSPMDWL